LDLVHAFSGLAGMFSKQAIEWLRQIFDQMFKEGQRRGLAASVTTDTRWETTSCSSLTGVSFHGKIG